MRPRWLLSCALCLGGCAVQAGAYAGRAVHARMRDRYTYGGQLASRVVASGVSAGVELAGQVEGERGSIPTWGVQLGLGEELGSRVGCALLGDLGTTSGLAGSADGYYAGLTLELPVRLRPRALAGDVNRNYRFLDQEGSVVPFVRARYFDLDLRGVREPFGLTLSLGLAVRTELVTDLVAF